MRFFKMGPKEQELYDGLEEADLEKLRNGYADMLTKHPGMTVSYEDFVLIACKVAVKLHRKKGKKADVEADRMIEGLNVIKVAEPPEYDGAGKR